MDRLAVLEHLDIGGDLLLAASHGFRIVQAKSQREAVLRAELCQHRLCLGLRIYRGLEIVRDSHALAASIGAIPAPVGLGRLDLPQSVLRHAPFRDQPVDIIDIDLAPGALLTASRVALQITRVVQALSYGIDPPPAKTDVDRLLRCDRL